MAGAVCLDRVGDPEVLRIEQAEIGKSDPAVLIP